MTAALYARVSTADQTCENQLLELRQYCRARGWTVWREFVDAAVSGSKDRRPALDDLIGHARRRRFDVVVCWRLDRLGRNLRHLVMALEEFQDLGVGFVSLGEGIDLGTPAGRLQLHILAALAEFERYRLQERVRAGLARVRAEGRKLGRPPQPVPVDKLATVAGLSVRDGARKLRISRSTLQRWRAMARRTASRDTCPSAD
jgi:DNA invertase Pin-like site-specific DNA recombinase